MFETIVWATDGSEAAAFSYTSTVRGASAQSNDASAITRLPGMLIASSRPSATMGSDSRQ